MQAAVEKQSIRTLPPTTLIGFPTFPSFVFEYRKLGMSLSLYDFDNVLKFQASRFVNVGFPLE